MIDRYNIDTAVEWTGIFVICDIGMLLFMKLLTFIAYAFGLSNIGEVGTTLGCAVSMLFAIAATFTMLIAIVIKICKGR